MDTKSRGWTSRIRRGRDGRNSWSLLALLGLAATLLPAAPASAFSFAVTGGGISAPSNNFGCDAAAVDCNAERRFDLALAGLAGGTIEIYGSVAVVTLEVLTVSFEDDAAAPGDSSGVVFSQVSYSGSANVITFGDLGTSFAAAYAGAGAAVVQGSYETLDDSRGIPDPPTPFSVDTSLLNLNCLVVDGTGQCSVQIGRAGFGLDVGGTQTDFVHTFNLSVTSQAVPPVPEPSTGMLVLCAGLVGLMARGARSR